MVLLEPQVISPLLPDRYFAELQALEKKLRVAYENKPYCDSDASDDEKFNRWSLHNPSLLMKFHKSRLLTDRAEIIFPEPVKPSYCYLSLYGPEGICPGHIDRPQCVYTIDLCISQKQPWPIFVGKSEDDKRGKEFLLNENEALCYSGTGQWHYRNKVQPGNLVTMAFFHFVPMNFTGDLN